jgi:hypothetical protein
LPSQCPENGVRVLDFRVVVRSTEHLARVLGVSPRAVNKAEEAGRIQREPDGAWDVHAVVNAWRDGVHSALQRDPPPWLNPHVELNPFILTRRARYLGARAEIRVEGGTGWEEHRDPVTRLNQHDDFDSDKPHDYLALAELNALFPHAGYLISFMRDSKVAAGLAKLYGITKRQARAVLISAIDFALAVHIAMDEQEALGPETPTQVRNGRVPLSALATGEEAA